MLYEVQLSTTYKYIKKIGSSKLLAKLCDILLIKKVKTMTTNYK